MDRRRHAWRTLAVDPVGSLLSAQGERTPKAEEPAEVLDGVVFEYALEPRCRVCAAPDEAVRILIDNLIVKALSFRAIVAAIADQMGSWEEKDRISYDSIRRHQLKHLPADELARRQIAERRAREQGLQIALADGPLVNSADFYEEVMRQTFEALVEGRVVPTLREGLAAARSLDDLDRDIEPDEGTPDIAAQLDALIELVKEYVGDDAWGRIVEQFRTRQGPGRPGARNGSLEGRSDDQA